MKYRDSLAFAFVQGFLEMWRGEFGRTHETLSDWNEAYDCGGNLAQRIREFFGLPCNF
jgi:hypothetical protein